MPLTLVTFDLDNTLWDVDTVIRKAEMNMRAWLEEHTPDAFAGYEPDNLGRLRAAIVETNPGLRHDLSAMRTAVLEQLMLETGYAANEARRLSETAFGIFFEGRHRVQYFDDALDTLEALADRYQLAALSNGNADTAKLGLDRYFSFALSAASVGASKPAPAMFEAALATSGCEPTAAAHIGDHLVDDIQGANAVGMHTVWVNFDDAPLPDSAVAPTKQVSALADLVAALGEV